MFKIYTDEDYKMVADGKEHISTPELDALVPLLISAIIAFSSLFVTIIGLV